MNEMSPTKFTLELLETQTLEQLIEIAKKLGAIWICQTAPPKWHASIKFDIVPGTKVEAESKYNEETPRKALATAIIKAQEIKAALK